MTAGALELKFLSTVYFGFKGESDFRDTGFFSKRMQSSSIVVITSGAGFLAYLTSVRAALSNPARESSIYIVKISRGFSSYIEPTF